MDKVLIGIEREKFLYLYKYNSCAINQSNIASNTSYAGITKNLDTIESNSIALGTVSKALETILPLYEDESEVILLDFDRRHIKYEHNLRIFFEGVHGIIPLTHQSFNLLQTRLNEDFNLVEPIPQKIYEEIFRYRQNRIRTSSLNKLLGLFDLSADYIDKKLRKDLETNVQNQLLNKFNNKSDSPFYYLLTYDTTPNFIPEGHIESFLKLGCIALMSQNIEESFITKGPFYSVCIKHKSEINKGSLFSSYETIFQLFSRLDSDKIKKIDNLKEILHHDFNELNTFLTYFIYLSLNRILQPKDFKIELLKEDLIELKERAPKELANALAIFAYVHSYERLYESFHRLSNSPIFKSSFIPIFLNQEKGQNSINQDDKKDSTNQLEQVIYKQEKKAPQEKEQNSTNQDDEKKSANKSEQVTNTKKKEKEPTLPFQDQEEPNNEGETVIHITDLDRNFNIPKNDQVFLKELKRIIQEEGGFYKNDLEKIFQKKPFRTQNGKLKTGAKRLYDEIIRNFFPNKS